MWGITIQNTGSAASVNSGNPVWLNIKSITATYGRENAADKGNADSLVKGDTMGRRIPSWILNGAVNNRGEVTASMNGLSCSGSTAQLLHAFHNLSQSVNSQIVVRMSWGGTGSTNFWIRDFDNNPMSSNTNIIIDSLTWDFKSDTEGNYLWPYTLNIRQVTPE